MTASDPYEAWAAVYPPRAHNALMEVEEAVVLSVLPPVKGRRVLDAGCGTGRYARLLTALGARVVGIDRSPAMLARARAHRVPLLRGDLAALPLTSASCDLVVCGLAIMDMSNLQAVAAEWARVLVRDGVVVYSTLHPIGRELGWVRTYSTEGNLHVLPACWHTAREQQEACERAGLAFERIEEPALAPGGGPAAMVVRARRRR